MAKKKKKKSWLKKVGKAAALAAAAYGASKMFGGRKGGQEGNIGIGLRTPRVDDYNYIPKPDYGNPEEGLFIGGKKGGRVTKRGIGIAKRGFGRALKGKK